MPVPWADEVMGLGVFEGFEEGFEEDSGEQESVVLGRFYPLLGSASAGLLGCVVEVFERMVSAGLRL